MLGSQLIRELMDSQTDLGRADDDYPLVYAILKCELLNYVLWGEHGTHMSGSTCRGWKRVSAALELELQSLKQVLGTKCKSSARAILKQ